MASYIFHSSDADVSRCPEGYYVEIPLDDREKRIFGPFRTPEMAIKLARDYNTAKSIALQNADDFEFYNARREREGE